MPELRITLTADQLAAAGLVIEQYRDGIQFGWFVNGEGPYDSPQAAALAGITRIYALYEEYRAYSEDDKEA